MLMDRYESLFFNANFKEAASDAPAVSIDETLHNMQELGVDLKIVDK